MTQGSETWLGVARELASEFRERAATYDREDRFVAENYRRLRQRRLFSVLIPSELGGGGADYDTVCEIVRRFGRGCGSTALAYSMHLHPVALNVFKYHRGQPAEAMLRKVAGSELIIAGTGANDGLGSSGSAEKVEGGYRVTGRKRFVSGCPEADVLVSSIRYEGGAEGPEVLHFSVPFSSAGVTIHDTWHAIGMRGTGSHDVELREVFVPDEAVVGRRPADVWHPLWDAILPTAMPIIMSAYLGIAEAAADYARDHAPARDEASPYLLAEMEQALTEAELAWRDMVRIQDDYRYAPGLSTTRAILVRKTLVARGANQAVEKAAETVGGRAFFQSSPLERELRDVRAAHFHPFPDKRQQLFTGRLALGHDPVRGEPSA